MDDTELSIEAREWIVACLGGPFQSRGEAALSFQSQGLAVPEQVKVVLTTYRAPHVGLPPGEHRVWLVVKDDPQSVFYDPATQKFGACWGPEKETGELIDLGFRSDDPFEMYVA